MERDFAELKRSVQYISDSFDEQKVIIEKLVLETKQLNEENKHIKGKVRELETKINDIEQREREKNLIINGIPKQENSNATEIVFQIAGSMNIHLERDSVCEAYRLGKREDAPLLVKLRTQEEKLLFLKKIKESKGLKTETCGFKGENGKIYINDDLTMQNQKLFKMAMEYKRLQKFYSVFTRHGRIFLKKSQAGDPIRIHTEEDLKI